MYSVCYATVCDKGWESSASPHTASQVFVCALTLSDGWGHGQHWRPGAHTLPSAAGGYGGPALPEHTPRLALQGVRTAAGAQGQRRGEALMTLTHDHTCECVLGSQCLLTLANSGVDRMWQQEAGSTSWISPWQTGPVAARYTSLLTCPEPLTHSCQTSSSVPSTDPTACMASQFNI